MTGRRRQHKSVLLTAVALYAILGVGVFASGLGARSLHLRLVRAEPAVDTTVTVAPKVLKLHFSESVKTALTAVRLTAADSSVVELAPLTLGEGKLPPVIATVKGVMKAGKHKVAWRTVGADGHALTGEYSLTVKAAAPGQAGGSPRHQ